MANSDPKLPLDTCAKLYSSLEFFLHDMIDQFDDIEQKSKDKLPGIDYKSVNQRKRMKKIRLDESQPNDAEETLNTVKNFA